MNEHYQIILEKLAAKYELEKFYGLTLYKATEHGFVYLRYSSPSKDGRSKFFFGIEKDALDQIIKANFTVIFVCGESSSTFIISKGTFLGIIENLPIKGNQWKINIVKIENDWYLKVTGKDKININKYLNSYDNVLSKINFGAERGITEFKYKQKIIEYDIQEEKLDLSQQLVERIKLNSRKSESPELFEKSIKDFFQMFGFECQHIGKSGTTDILITEPFRVIIEAKSTSREMINKIYFTRLKQHKLKHNAERIIVIANDFAPSVITDSKIENSILLKTEIIYHIIELNRLFPISADDLKPIFDKTGLIVKEDLNFIELKINELDGCIRQLRYIINSIDDELKNIDEIFGKYTYICQQSNIDNLDKTNFIKMLEFLSLSCFNLVIKEQGRYKKEISTEIALKRLSIIGRKFHES